MIVLGVDPGVDGAAVILDDTCNKVLSVIDLPVIRSGAITWIDGAVLGDWLEEWHPEMAYVERIAYWAGDKNMGHTQALVRIAGGVEAIISSLPWLGFDHVQPSVWKRRAGLKGGDKVASLMLARARLNWPDGDAPTKAKHHNRADAGLIALFGRAPAAAVKPAKRAKTKVAAEPGSLL